MTGILRWFLRSPVAANLLMVGLLAAGIAAMATLTVRTFPEIATQAVSVTVAYPGATPTEVADAILTPIEERLEGLEGIRQLNGTATSGAGTVTAELTRGADLTEVKDDIEVEVARITTFPAAAEQPRVVEVEPVELAVQIAIHGPLDAIALKALAERARDELTDLPEVSQVDILGVREDLIEIEIRREALEGYGIGLTELSALLAADVLDLSGGTIDTGRRDIQIRATGAAEEASELREKVLFTDPTGARVRLGDIARIGDRLAETDIVAEVNGQPAVFLSVNRAGGEQVLTVADAATGWLEEEFRSTLAPGVTAEIWRDEAETLRGRIALLAENAAIGLALVLVLLTLFLDLRVAFWVAAGVAVTFVGAFALMLAFGTTINQLSLFGFILALGIVVDDAIVVGERTFGELEGDGDPEKAADRAVRRVWRPVAFSVTTSIAAFVPLLFLPGSSGSFIAPVAAVVIYLLVVSLIESFFILPRHLSHIRLGRPRRWSPRRVTDWLRNRVDRGFKWFTDRAVRPLVKGSVGHPVFALVCCLTVGAMGVALVAGGTVRFVFFPEIEGNFVTAELSMPEGTSAEATAARAVRFVDAAERIGEELGGAGLLLGTSVVIGFSPTSGPNGAGAASGSTATISARLMDGAERDIAAETFRNRWREAVGDVPGAREVVYSASTVAIGAPISLEVSADSDEAREEATGRLREALQGRDGVFDLRDDRFSASREVAISLTRAAPVYGVALEDVAREVRAAVYGAIVDQFARNREEVDIRVRLPSDQRDSISDLAQLRIPTATGGLVPLALVAELEFRPAPTEITRLNGRRITVLEADVDGSVTTGGAETAWVLQNVVPEITRDLPSVSVSAGGEQEEAGRFGPALAFNFSLALFAIYATLSLAFGSYLRPLIVLGIVPFGLVGAIFGHALLGLNLTLLSMFGVVGLAGVIVNDALLIVDYILEAEADGKPWHEAITEATLGRFRPVILTTLTTVLGISPLILETSVQAQFLIPTAVSLGFGVAFVSIFQMVLVPAYASIYARLRNRFASSGRSATAG
ncbi:efflux RND transporter permease subunit [Jannaschia aquimarina]|uniref:MdtB_2 protein n=1 Tax=Jannaschia aquimarina TaxID=935700 RepID=A0A0D1EB11_9RHOB|nr:efflux RND transporter permease subunit [Jannaschia aquimarina]KIT14934.1 Multidrug resistance protein MdtB [Jannaschia aquimarina]SNS59757.1 Multidrug efflux pump subunit AcrB [Jannaschia aquimarina]